MKPTQTAAFFLGVIAACCGCINAAIGATVTLTPTKDNTLIEPVIGDQSNGQGDGIFTGRIGFGANLRAVLAFDVAADVPKGSTINSVALELQVLQVPLPPDPKAPPPPPQVVQTIHRLLGDWGEGASAGFGGLGSEAQEGDATWMHRFYPGTFWLTPGGDFQAIPSGTYILAQVGPYSFSAGLLDGLTADVQSWLDNPASNFGWLIRGDETTLFTARKIGSRNHALQEYWPRLVIDYTPPTAACPGNLNDDDIVNVDDLLTLLASWGPCLACVPDINGDGFVNVDDLLLLLQNWGPCKP